MPADPSAHVIVVGAGPSGLMAAIRAAEGGARVTVLERTTSPGQKLLAAGGGRANVTNTLSETEFVAQFGRKGRFMLSALRELPRDELLRLLAHWGAPCECTDGQHFFPVGNRAVDVLRALRERANELGVAFVAERPVTRLIVEDGRVTGVVTVEGDLLGDAVVLATGGAGYPRLGGNRSGYDIARDCGHRLVDPTPGLVALRTKEEWPGTCPGISIAASSVRIAERKLARDAGREEWLGPLLFTHHGLSGPAVLDASGTVLRLLASRPEVPLRIRLTEKAMNDDARRALLTKWRGEHGGRPVHCLLSWRMPLRLAEAICEAHGIGRDQLMADLTREGERQLACILEGPIVHVTGSGGFDHAMVTAGGVALPDVNSGTLASKHVEGLYFAGEMLDLDGPCGGFNLQWAFSSGWLAGKSAAAYRSS